MKAIRPLALLLAATLGACLPEDTREEPGSLSITIRGTDATVDGFDTKDGWRVTFDRVIVAVGAPQFTRDGVCSPYSDGEYLRVIDGRRREPEKLALLYGLGSCRIELYAGNPGFEAILGVGVSEDVKFAMREPGSDAHVKDAGITFWIAGRAARGSESKSFEWRYRRRRLHYSDCSLPAPIVLDAGIPSTLEVRVHAPALFEDEGFDRFAAADANGDAAITLDELDAATLGRQLYDELFPRVIRIGDAGLCKAESPRFGPD